MHEELASLEEALEQIAAVAPAVGASARSAAAASSSGGGSSALSGSSQAKQPAMGELQLALLEVQSQLQAREVEVASLKTSLKAARAGGPGGGKRPASPRRGASLGGMALGALLGGGDDDAASAPSAAAAVELSELEKTLSQVESALPGGRACAGFFSVALVRPPPQP